MKNILITICIIGLLNGCAKSSKEDYTQYVNTLIGCADNGHTFPGACVPFGLIQVSPETGTGSWRYCSGFNYDDDYIEGFSQTHLNGTGVPDLGDVLMYPFCGVNDSIYKSKYDKASQQAVAGYYSVSLVDALTDVELTATPHTAFHRYTFKDTNAKILLDLQRGLVGGIEKLQERIISLDLSMPDQQTIVGHYDAKAWVRRQVYFVLKFDKPYSYSHIPNTTEQEKGERLLLSFDLKRGEQLQAKIAISSVGIEGAMASMNEENPGWNFDLVRNEAHAKWNEILSRVHVDGTEKQKTNFYTSLYHLCIQPNNIADINGKYRGVDDRIHESKTGEFYSTFSLWDTYRAAHPLYTILTPEKVNHFVQSMIEHHNQQGYLPIWSLWGKENFCMIGNHAIPVIVDAYLKGFRGFDIEEAYKAVKETSMTNHKNSDWNIYNKYGYYPFDLINVESVSRTLEVSYDDYCVGVMAQALGKETDADFFGRRSLNYRNLFDSETKLMRGKSTKGEWRTPFNPFLLSHASSSGGEYTEGNAWQYTWHVQHDVEELIELMGGKTSFVSKLDSLFFLDVKADNKGFVSDVTGLIGQYAHGNEPSHHVAYLYNYAGRKDRTEEIIREIFNRFYLPKPDGLCGNDD